MGADCLVLLTLDKGIIVSNIKVLNETVGIQCAYSLDEQQREGHHGRRTDPITADSGHLSPATAIHP